MKTRAPSRLSKARPSAAPRETARRPRREALLELLESLARAANEAASPEAAMRTCLEQISAYANWSLGRVAVLMADAPVPTVEASLWHGGNPERCATFMRLSETYDYSRLTGKFISVVLREQRAVWIADFEKAKPPGRLVEAGNAGLRSAFAFPIVVQGKVAAFLEFFAQEPRRVDRQLLRAIGTVGAQLARLIERSRAEAVHAQLAAIVEGSDDAIYSRALDGTVLSWNGGAEHLFGYTAAEIIGRNISVMSPPEFAGESRRNTEALLRGDPVPPFETVRLAKDGRLVDVQIGVSPICDTGGKVTAIAAIMRDIGQRKQAEAERARLAAIVESSQDAIISTAPDRTIRTWNAGAERMFGYKAAEVVGRDVGLLVPEERRHELGQRRSVALSGRQAPPHETERLTKNGGRIPVSISASPLTDGAGNVTGVALIYRDVGELKRAQRELERKARLSELMESLARAANEATTPEDAMRACLAKICAHGDWALGRLGIYGSAGKDQFPERSIWHSNDEARYEPFIAASLDARYFRSKGQFVSVVVQQRKPVWLADIKCQPGFGRAEVAIACGLESTFAFPVIVGGEVAAFMEFYATEPREPDQPLIDALGTVAAQLARLIERRRAEAAQAQLAAIIESSDDAIVSRDLDRRIVTWNAAAERLFGYTAAEVIGRDISLMIPADQEPVAAQNRALLAAGEPVPVHDAVRLTKDGKRIEVSVTQSPIKDASGNMIGASLIFRDISERKQAEEKIRQLAHYDSLTGLPNRALFYDRLRQAIGLARREGHEVALMYVDLDRFKAVNDTLGHDAGDELLKTVAERIRDRLRESDTVARVGGDEFIAILPKIADREDVAMVAAKLLETLSAPFQLGGAGREASVGSSIGIAIYPADAEESDALIKAADTAMYRAKEAGNRFAFFSRPELGQEPKPEPERNP